MMRSMPNFFLVGAAKAGTTSLVAYMKQHPDIYLSPVKEPKYFSYEDNTFPHNGPGAVLADRKVVSDLRAYMQLFSGAEDYPARGEASVDYLYFEGVPERIHRILPDAKIIIILRNPVERAYSAYLHYLRDGRETLSFEDALAEEETRRKNNWEFFWQYRAMGYYSYQVERYFSIFPHEQLLITLYDELLATPEYFLRCLFDFLGVDYTFTPNISRKYNKSGQPRSRIVHKLLNEPNPLLRKSAKIIPGDIRQIIRRAIGSVNIKGQQLKASTHKELLAEYLPDIRRLEGLIHQDLSIWYKRDFLSD